MTATAQVIAATPPAPPTAATAVPAPPTNVVVAPAPPLIIIDGTPVPVIPAFVSANFGANGMPAAPFVPTARTVGASGGPGFLTLAMTSAQPSLPGFAGIGSVAMPIAVGQGGVVVVAARFGATGGASVSNAAFGGTGQLSVSLTPKSVVWPSFYGTGTATGTISYVASFNGIGSATVESKPIAPVPEAVTGSGSATATVVVNGKAVLSAGFGGAGMTSSVVVPAVSAPAAATGVGVLTAVTGVCTPAVGTGTLSASLGVPAAFGGAGTDSAEASFPAAGGGLGTLTMPVVSTVAARFGGSGGLVGMQAASAWAGAGTLSMRTGGAARLGAAGSAAATTGGPGPFTGAGTLSATSQQGFKPSGMTKNGTQQTPSTQNAWAPILGWTANTATYPGSVVASNALVSQGDKASVTVAAGVAWTASMFGNVIQVCIKKNGTVIATSTAASTSPATVSATLAVANGEQITVEVCDTGSYANYPATITAGSTTYVRIT
ncbi:hypothetical protein AB0N05_35195 [Nocardia sp. NPDC051030]|uniref:hypothetical protein n=1 Tax=Nocardia sp. NPDC051030 TaxID=3155162 RepID=UPI003413392D